MAPPRRLVWLVVALCACGACSSSPSSDTPGVDAQAGGGGGGDGPLTADGALVAGDGGASDLAALPPTDAMHPDLATDLGMKKANPTPRGLWIWSMQGKADPASVVATNAAKWGVSYVVIQAANPPGTSVWTQNFNAMVISEFTSRGIDVYGMSWVLPDDGTPNNLQMKIDTASAIANVPGSKGVVMDTEWQWWNRNADATTLCTGTRGKAPGRFIGYTATFNYTYPGGNYTGTPQYFPQFPWKEFDSGCGDGFFPQSYYSVNANQDPLFAWNFTVGGAKALGLKAPIWAIQDFNDTQVSVSDIDVFFALAGPHAGLWRYPYPDDALNATNHTQLGQIHWTAASGDAHLGSCPTVGYWCGKSAGGPASATATSLYYCPGAGAAWLKMEDCAQCYTCPSGVADTCDAAAASASGCH